MSSPNNDVESPIFESYLFGNGNSNLAEILNIASAGIWQLKTDDKKSIWSLGFYKMLGYQPGEIQCSYNSFLEEVLYYEDHDKFLKSLNNVWTSSGDAIDVRLLTKKGYRWFQCDFQKDDTAGNIVGTFVNIHHFKISQLQLAIDNQLIKENSKLIKMGRWDFDVTTNKITLSKEALEILDIATDINDVDIEQFISFFDLQSRQKLRTALETCIKSCRPFDLDFKLITAGNNTIWSKIKAIATIDHYGKCISIKGVIQDIDVSKKNEHQLKSSLTNVNAENKRLQNFAYIVSHNLRSYVGNLEIMVNLHEEAENIEDKTEIFGHIKTVSGTLSTMIQHLNEIVKIDKEKTSEKTLIEFDLLFKNIFNALQANVQHAGAIVKADFTKCRSVQYLPAYLESIFHNLLSNSLKYRHPDRNPVIKIESKIENGHVYLVFEDNGVGIDMEKYGDKIFGMYQTFHENEDAQGIGLYITRNQIEALGGSIRVESVLNSGTRFIIRLT
ncbi:ATP-binding protein [Mucilaginibacter lutimaris]|uniref:histidine kinase n=1 Tax=Mucilaginibacter lutimaris TaxID=931629 RepID=A0ABW2ZL29_9SPHI